MIGDYAGWIHDKLVLTIADKPELVEHGVFDGRGFPIVVAPQPTANPSEAMRGRIAEANSPMNAFGINANVRMK